MTTLPKYSVVLSPPDETLELVKALKQRLRAAIGWYKSVNALAHITFNVFEADETMLQQWEAYLTDFAARQQYQPLLFDHTGTFANGAFFLAPDAASEHVLVRMMKDFHGGTFLDAPVKSATPHISIGRQLTADELATAHALIPEVALGFTLQDIVLRRFNESRKQYDIYKRFAFGGAGQRHNNL